MTNQETQRLLGNMEKQLDNLSDTMNAIIETSMHTLRKEVKTTLRGAGIKDDEDDIIYHYGKDIFDVGLEDETDPRTRIDRILLMMSDYERFDTNGKFIKGTREFQETKKKDLWNKIREEMKILQKQLRSGIPVR